MIGLGLMGEVISGRLMAAGFGVHGFDIDPAKTAKLSARGGQAGTLAEVAWRDVVVLAVFNTDQVEQVVEQRASGRSAKKGRQRKDRALHLDLRSRPDRYACGARDAERNSLSGDTGLGNQ